MLKAKLGIVPIEWRKGDLVEVSDDDGDPDWERMAKEELPMGRLIDPCEVTRAAFWMVSDDSGFLTGAVIPFDQSVWGGHVSQAVGPAENLRA